MRPDSKEGILRASFVAPAKAAVKKSSGGRPCGKGTKPGKRRYPDPRTGRAARAYTPKVKRLPRLEATSRSGMRRRMASMKAAPVQCIGTTTSGARRSSSSMVCSI